MLLVVLKKSFHKAVKGDPKPNEIADGLTRLEAATIDLRNCEPKASLQVLIAF